MAQILNPSVEVSFWTRPTFKSTEPPKGTAAGGADEMCGSAYLAPPLGSILAEPQGKRGGGDAGRNT